MRRIKLILAATAAMATLMVVAASPAMAQTFFIDRGDFDRFDRDRFVGDVGPADQEFSIRRLTSGAANPVTRISNTGNNVNLCTPVQQVANTGNVANEQGVVEDNASGFDTFGFDRGFDRGFGRGGDLDFTGSESNIAPTATAECTQTIEQAAAA